MRILELFSGYGSQALALENLGIDFTSDISEIDKYAIQAYDQLHGATHNWGDICKIDETQLPYYDLITYSSPCQDFSVAGLQKGGDAGTGTRSSLLWECERIIRAVKPKYLLMENVKNLVGERHKHNFIKWLKVLESLGYQNFWKVLNAKDYGVPQNRERVFVVSIFGGGQYLFPNPIKLEKRLKDVLESNVDEKYYLSSKTINMFLRRNELNKAKGNGFKFETANINSYASAITTRAEARADDNFIQEPQVINPLAGKTEYGWHFEQEVYDDNGIARAAKAGGGSGNIPKVMQLGNIVETDSFGGNPQCGRIYSDNGLSPTLNTMQGGGREPKILKNYRIRKLTPRECWRLMGVKDEQFNKLHDISNTQLYKMAGNSIVVDVLMGIFKNLFLSDDGTSGQLTLL